MKKVLIALLSVTAIISMTGCISTVGDALPVINSNNNLSGRIEVVVYMSTNEVPETVEEAIVIEPVSAELDVNDPTTFISLVPAVLSMIEQLPADQQAQIIGLATTYMSEK